jgi:hypothetical protein
MKQYGDGCRSVADSLARALATLVVATFVATAGVGCGGSDESRQGAGTAAPGAGGGNATNGAQNGQGGTGGAGTGTPAAAPGTTLFAHQYGDDGQQTLTDLAVDDAGASYVVGLEGPTGGSVFALQYDATGELRWRQPFVADDASSESVAVEGIAVQPTTGAVILAGFLSGSITVGGVALSSANDTNFGLPLPNLWLTALDKAGYVVWSRVFSSPQAVFPSQVFVTASGDIEVTGTVRENATVGGGPLCCDGPDLGTTTFLARYSPTGDHLWSEAIGGRFFPAGVDTDAAGGMVVGGSLSGTATFDGQTFVDGGTAPDGTFVNDGLVLRLAPDGHEVWNKLLPADQHIFPGARLDGAGNILLFGTFQGNVDLGNGQHLGFTPPVGVFDAAFLAKLAPDGTAQWAQALQPLDGVFVATGDLATDAAGDMVLTGMTNGGLSLAGVPGRADVGSGDFIAKYAPDGTNLWSRGFAVQAGVQEEPFVAVAVEPSGRVTSAGNFDNTVDFGTGPLTAPGVLTGTGRGAPAPHIPDDVFVVRLAP